MAKLKRVILGEVMISDKETNPDYIKLKPGVKIPENGILRVETKAYQLKSLDQAVSANRMSQEMANEMKSKIEERSAPRS